MTVPKRQFLSFPSALEREAVQALDAVVAHPTHRDSAMRIYATAVAKERYRAFMARYGVHPRTDGHVCLYRLLGSQRCPERGSFHCDSPYILPGTDHTSEWMKERRTYCLVSQPYDWSWRTMCETVDLGRKLGFEVTVDAQYSWHFPGWTTLVMYRKA